jgi:hypothetical protein
VRLGQEATAPTVQLGQEATAPTVRLGQDATAPTVRLGQEATAPTVRLGQDATAPTVRLGQEATAPTVRLGQEATAPTVRLGQEATAPTVRLGQEATAPTVRLGQEATAPTVKLPPPAPTPRDVWLEPLSRRPSAAGSGAPPIRMFVTSLGTSTGEAFEVRVVNDGDRPIRLRGGSFVLEPIAASAQQAVQREAQQAAAAGEAKTMKLNAYCLEFLLRPPAAGTIFRIAPAPMQQRFASARRLLRAAKRVRDMGRLTPDTRDAAAYFHSIAQWAIWTEREGFRFDSFEKAFVAHTRKNVEAAGQSWSKRAEEVVANAAKHRWTDITEILRVAAPPAGGRR